MLLSYKFSNFHSFGDIATVSFELRPRDSVHGWDRTSPSGRRVSTAVAVIGPNGAGKSNLVKAGPFLAWFVRDSFNLRPEDHIPFMQHQAYTDRPAVFEVEADAQDGSVWRYELHAMPDRVLHESLHRRSTEPNERFRYVFTRDWTGTEYEVKQHDFGLAESEAKKVRPNVSFISWAKQYGAELASRVSSVHWNTNLHQMGRAAMTPADLWSAAELFSTNETLREQMRSLLKSWDLGLSDVDLRKYELTKPGEKDVKPSWFLWGIHSSKGKRFELPFGMESSGTQTALLLLWRILPTLANGGVAFIDELESDLHPHMIEPILRLFHDQDTNPHSAQILFTSQSPEVLRLLRRAQVLFVEKDDCLSSTYRGDEIEGLTSEHNLYAKYMSGALGAVPDFERE